MRLLKIVVLLVLVLPLAGIAQVSVSGNVLNQTDSKPVANASVFLSNATNGDKTATNGNFKLMHVKPGKYDLVVSIVGFETYRQTLTVNNNDLILPAIAITPKTIILNEVSIKPIDDADRVKYLEWFKDEFLGTSALAGDCKILNPEVLNLNYDKEKEVLTASTDDFLEIQNRALGYRVKYLIASFVLNYKNEKNTPRTQYIGSTLFENLQGSYNQMRDWQAKRLEVYNGSPLHFMRALLDDKLQAEGFKVSQIAVYQNPQRPADSVINSKIAFYKNAKPGGSQNRDSLSAWAKKLKLPKTLQTRYSYALGKSDLITATNQAQLAAFGCDNDRLYITYTKNPNNITEGKRLYAANNAAENNTTVVSFLSPFAFIGNNGRIVNPYSLFYEGKWGEDRVAELLPLDYEPPLLQAKLKTDTDKNIADKLQNYISNNPVEKVYLHFDKPYYAAGDTIYFKAYLAFGEQHMPSGLSGVLHVDLINTGGKISQSLNLQAVNGAANGDFALPDSLLKGNYSIRAYTNWMRNAGDGSYFEQLIPVGSAVNEKIAESSNKAPHQTAVNKIDVQFFPQGGSFVARMANKVAFKAVGQNGLGINASGEVLDDENKTIATFASTHLGMGSFVITPQPGKLYKAKINYGNGSESICELPKAVNEGLILSVNNDSLPKAVVKISASKGLYSVNKGKNYKLLISSGGIINSVNCKLDSEVICLDILKRRLHTGVATVTVFSPGGEPLCERLLFVQNYDQLNVAVSSDKLSYSTRGKTTLNIDVKNRADQPAVGNFSVAVVDESKLPVDGQAENTILNYLLLTSDLKGYVEQPDYYFTNTSDKTNAGLDLVMLTHGYRRFAWAPVIAGNATRPVYQPETFLTISGVAKSLSGKPLQKATVSLIPSKNGDILSSQTDDNGHFAFNNLLFADTARFILQAVNAKGANKTQLIYNKEMPPPVSERHIHYDIDAQNQLMAAYMDNHTKQLNEYSIYGTPKGVMLKQVDIKSKLLKRDDDYHSSSLGGPGHADQVVTGDELANAVGPTMSDRLAGKLHGRAINSLSGHISAGLYIVDGMRMNKRGVPPFNMDKEINPDDIETVEFLTGANAAIYGLDAAGGVLVLTSKHRNSLKAKDIASVGVLPVTVQGFYKAREFYAPKYDVPNQLKPHADLRSTIYWNANVTTDQYGKAGFSFFNADGKGKYRVTIEGIDDKGNLGRQVYRYTVQ